MEHQSQQTFENSAHDRGPACTPVKQRSDIIYATPPFHETPNTKRNRRRRRSTALWREKKSVGDGDVQSFAVGTTLDAETPNTRRKRKARERKSASRSKQRLCFSQVSSQASDVSNLSTLNFRDTTSEKDGNEVVLDRRQEKRKSTLPLTSQELREHYGTPSQQSTLNVRESASEDDANDIVLARRQAKRKSTAPLTSQELREHYGTPSQQCSAPDYASLDMPTGDVIVRRAVVGVIDEVVNPPGWPRQHCEPVPLSPRSSPTQFIDSVVAMTDVVTTPSSVQHGKKRKRKHVPPMSTPEVNEMYPTPTNEAPDAKRIRLNCKRSSMTRMKVRRNKQRAELLQAERIPEPSFQLLPDEFYQTVEPSIQRPTRRPTSYRCAVVMLDAFSEKCVVGKDIKDGRQSVGQREVVCDHCLALKWKKEKPKSCCLDGVVQLPPVNPYPEQLKVLFNSRRFMQYIRAYNSIFAFTSIGADVGKEVDIDEELANGRDGVYTYRLHGSFCHRIGSLLPPPEGRPHFAQIYFFDSDMSNQVEQRMSIMDGLDRNIVTTIQSVMMELNPFAQQFITAGELSRTLDGGIATNVNIVLHETSALDLRVYNQPTASEVAAIIVNNNNAHNSRDLVLRQRRGGFLRVFETWPSYDPLQYPLLFPRGEEGWHKDVAVSELSKRKRERVSAAEFCAYRLYEKAVWDPIFHAGRLMQQYVVDQYAKVEQQRLLFQKNYQKKLRGEVLVGLQDMVEGDEGLRNFKNLGTRKVLTSSFTNGPRYMRNEYLNSMAVVRDKGKPHLFITMTANASWPEITAELHAGQTAVDRPELVTRVFKLKLDALMEDLTKRMVFGKVIGHVHVVEFQKRGLPHAHILLIMDEADKPRSVEDYDKFVSAELPDQRTHPELFRTVSSCMIHGPCGARFPTSACMEKGKCRKKYPRPFCEETTADYDGYPRYRRRDVRTPFNRVFKKGMRMGNESVVPYNPYLSMKYNCHINVEVCSTITAVKYLYKYVYKGSDRAAVSVRSNLNDRDEIQEYLDARYVSSSEACWRLYRYPLHGRSHSVIALEVHAERHNYVVFDPEQDGREIMLMAKHTRLTRFFDLCKVDPFARTLLYQEVPKYYKWSEHNWHRRVQSGESVIGRLITCSPTDVERYHLRMLLCYRRGPTSFEDLRTVGTVVHASFQATALALGYIADDGEYDKTMTEAATEKMPAQLRKLFATILAYCQPADPLSLWNKHLEAMAEDFTWNAVTGKRLSYKSQGVIFKVAKSVDEYLSTCSGAATTLKSFRTLPQLSDFEDIDLHLDTRDRNPVLEYELSYSRSRLQSTANLAEQMNQDQRTAFSGVMAAIRGESTQKLFYLDGPGGTGKTFLIEQLLAQVRLDGKVALATATSGIAALLLTGGRTVHSRFKVPVDTLDESSVCNIPKQGQDAALMKRASFIVIDEAPMLNRFVVECLDRSLRDLRDVYEPFGGIVVLFSGDFRQTLPVIPKAAPGEIIGACLQRWQLWSQVTRYRLTINERLRRGMHMSNEERVALEKHAEFLLSVGDGSHDVHPDLGAGYVKLPTTMMAEPSSEDNSGLGVLINHVYPDIYAAQDRDASYFASRMILAPKNVEVHSINTRVLDMCRGNSSVYQSIDSVECDDDANLYPPEFLNSIEVSGLPRHKLELKTGVPIMLMRNLNAQEGLCNGTRLQVVKLKPHCIVAKILTGANSGKTVFIPRVTLSTSATEFPFTLKRRQFPVRLAFAMTINKSQGQSVDTIGLYLPEPVFAHGQLYVALSRATSTRGLKIVVLDPPAVEDEGTWTNNVVYRQLFTD